MELFTKSVKNSYFTIGAIIFLLLLNLVIYFDHYFYETGFPYDFAKNYWVIPAFWLTALDFGIFPQWVPFQAMGFPLLIYAQSSLYYPFLWLFHIFSIPFTLQNAVIFQNLHIFFGSVGMFFFLKFLFKSPRYAIIGAIAFQFFGGFFANASHVDIVRSFSIAPWMFYVFTLNLEKPKFCKRMLFIPIVIFLLAIGGYFGILLASIFMMGMFVILQVINSYFRGIEKLKSIRMGVVMIGLMFLGMSMAFVHFGPFLEYGDALIRFDPEPDRWQGEYQLKQTSSFFLSNSAIPGTKEFSSTFLTLPILIFASFCPISTIKKYWIFLVIAVVGFLMALGKPSFLYQIITDVFPILELSRFPVGDYRIFFAIPLLIFAIGGLKAIIERKFTLKKFAIRVALIISWFALGVFIFLSFGPISEWIDDSYDLNLQPLLAVLILIITLSLVGFFVMTSKKFLSSKKSIEFSFTALIIFTVIIIANGMIVINDMRFVWVEEPYDKLFRENEIPLEVDGKLRTYDVFKNLPDQRPQRQPSGDYTGWLTGDYRTTLKGSSDLKVSAIVESDKNYRNYMFMRWTPILVEPPANSETQIQLPEEIFANVNPKKQIKSIVQTHYGINDITYQISLNEPKLLIENEIYFPGWKATLVYPDKQLELEAIEVNDIFRAWLLPAGDYEMTAYFEFPDLQLYQSVTIVSLVVWIGVVIVFWRKIKSEEIVKMN